MYRTSGFRIGGSVYFYSSLWFIACLCNSRPLLLLLLIWIFANPFIPIISLVCFLFHPNSNRIRSQTVLWIVEFVERNLILFTIPRFCLSFRLFIIDSPSICSSFLPSSHSFLHFHSFPLSYRSISLASSLSYLASLLIAVISIVFAAFKLPFLSIVSSSLWLFAFPRDSDP